MKIITAIAEDSHLDEVYIENIMATYRFRTYPITIGRTFSYPYFTQQNEIKLLLSRQRVLKTLWLKEIVSLWDRVQITSCASISL